MNSEKVFSGRMKRVLQKYPQLGTLTAFVLIIVLFSIAAPTFCTVENVINILNQTASTSIVAFGMTMVLLVGGMDLSAGGILALVAMISAKLMADFGMNAMLVVPIGLMLGAFIGFCNGFIITKFNIQPFLVTLGMMSVTRGFAKFSSNGQSVFIRASGFRQVFSQGNVLGIPVLMIWTVIILLATFFLIKFTPFGRHVQAIGGNQIAAQNSGVKVKRVKCTVFALNGLLAALAGFAMLSRLSTALPTMATGIEMDSIAATVLGGTGFSGEGGNMLGTLLGALVIGTVINGLTILGVDPYIQDVIKGLIIIVTVVSSELMGRRDTK